MVRLTSTLCKYIPKWYAIDNSPSKKFHRRYNMYRMTQYFYGRSRNCFKLAVKKLHKELQYENRDRSLKKLAYRDLYSQRIVAACREHDYPHSIFLSSLSVMGVELDRYALSCLAIWEPRTFQALVELAKECEYQNPQDPLRERVKPASVISRGNLDNLTVSVPEHYIPEK